MTKYFVLDTNALYNYIGRNELGLPNGIKVDKSYIKMLDNNIVILPSSTFLEVVIHFRNQFDKLQDIFYFLAEKKLKIIPNGTKQFSTEELEEFCKANNKTKIKIINDWLKIKVDTEVRVSYLFLLGLTMITGMFLIWDLCKKKNLNCENHVEKLYKLLEEKRNDDLKYFNEELLSYYAKNDGKEGKNFKIIFNSKLNEYFYVIYKLLYTINYKENVTFDEKNLKFIKIICQRHTIMIHIF